MHKWLRAIPGIVVLLGTASVRVGTALACHCDIPSPREALRRSDLDGVGHPLLPTRLWWAHASFRLLSIFCETGHFSAVALVSHCPERIWRILMALKARGLQGDGSMAFSPLDAPPACPGDCQARLGHGAGDRGPGIGGVALGPAVSAVHGSGRHGTRVLTENREEPSFPRPF